MDLGSEVVDETDRIQKENTNSECLPQKKTGIMERTWSSGFCRIFTVAFLLFLASAGGSWGSYPAGPISNPAGQSLTFT